MTAIIRTKSHGDVQSGFVAIFTGLVRVGDICIPTKHFCEATRFVAEHPDTTSIKVMSYSAAKFETLLERQALDFMRSIERMEASNILQLMGPRMAEFDLSQHFVEQQKQGLSMEGWTPLKIEIDNTKAEVKAGEYVIGFDEFAEFSLYVVKGGFVGWMNQQFPDYASEAHEAIKSSKNELFKYIRED